MRLRPAAMHMPAVRINGVVRMSVVRARVVRMSVAGVRVVRVLRFGDIHTGRVGCVGILASFCAMRMRPM